MLILWNVCNKKMETLQGSIQNPVSSKIECFAKIVNGFLTVLIIFIK